MNLISETYYSYKMREYTLMVLQEYTIIFHELGLRGLVACGQHDVYNFFGVFCYMCLKTWSCYLKTHVEIRISEKVCGNGCNV